MASAKAIVSTLLFLAVLLQGCHGNPCNIHLRLPAEKRWQFNFLEDAAQAICDKELVEGWYRVVDGPAGNDMVTTCPAQYHCGTNFPIWLNGKLPGQGEEKQMRACQRNDENCCSKEIPVTVKNCGTYNVYYLTTTQITKCNAAFCFGDTTSCPKGESSETGNMPGCSADFPIIPATTEVSLYTRWDRNGSHLFFHCKLPTFQSELFYDVEWYYEDVKVHNASDVSGRTPNEADMSDAHWFMEGRQMGFDVHCRIRGRKTVTGTPSIWQKSPAKYIGLKLGSNTLRIPEGGSGVIEVQLTAPFPCRPNLPNKRLCAMYVSAEIPEWNGNCGGDPIFTVADKCRLTIYGEDWDKVHHFNIRAKSDDIIRQGDVQNYVTLKMPALADYPTWAEHKAPIVAVSIFDTDHMTSAATCTSFNDPHIVTFDKKKIEFHDSGEFVLYSVDGLPVEIHAVFQPCTWGIPGATCNCGVAVRAGYDLYAIYTCNDAYAMEGEISCGRNEHLQIGKDGKNTWIRTPNGAVLRVLLDRKNFINLQLDISQTDKGKTRGICGTFNNNPQDDEPQIKLNGKYRVSKKDSFFKRQGEQPPWAKDKAGVCKCENAPENRTADFTCDWGQGVRGCLPPGLQDRTCHRRSKRDIMKEDYVDFDVDAVQIVEAEGAPDMSWKGDWTEQKARDFCEKFINQSASVRMCKEALRMDDAPSIEMCILDIRLSGSKDWAVDAIERLKGSCMREVSRDSKYWASSANQSESNVTSNPLAGLREQLEEVTCPAECNFRGECVNGVCKCENGYEGNSCDVDMSVPPNVAHIPFGGLCDVTKRPCRIMVAMGSSFANTSTLACKTEEIVVTETGVRALGQSYVTTAHFESYSEVLCTVHEPRDKWSVGVAPPGARGFLVSVANDGKTFGKAMPFVTFNPACLDCVAINNSARCEVKTDACFIEGLCYQPGQRKQGQSCLMCDPSVSSSSWTTSADSCWIDGICYAEDDSLEGQACVRCQPSRSRGQWQLQPSFCRINGLCVQETSESPQDPCYMCDSSFAPTQWKLKDSCQDKKLWLIGVVLGIVVIVAAVVGVIVWKVKGNRSKICGDWEVNEATVNFSKEAA